MCVFNELINCYREGSSGNKIWGHLEFWTTMNKADLRDSFKPEEKLFKEGLWVGFVRVI